MAASTIEGIMSGIETNLKTISGLRTAAYLADQINTPMAVVAVPDIPEYRGTFRRGKFTVDVSVHILVSASLDRAGQTLLASYADVSGSNSIPNAIEVDRTLGGAVDDCAVISFRTLRLEEVGVIGYYGGVFTVRVVARGA